MISLFDTHIHVLPDTDLEKSVLMAREHGFRYWLLSVLWDDTQGKHRLFPGNEHMLAVVAKYHDVFTGFGLIQLNKDGYPGFPRGGPDTPDHVRALWQKGCKGIKIFEPFSRIDVADTCFDPIYAKVAELKMPIVFHTGPEGAGDSCAKVARVAERFPQLPVMMAHLYGMEQLEIIIPRLKTSPNLFMQHMHLLSIKDKDGRTALSRLIEEGLTTKIVFGTDLQKDHTPLVERRRLFIRRLKESDVTDNEINKIMFATAEDLLSRVEIRRETGD